MILNEKDSRAFFAAFLNEEHEALRKEKRWFILHGGYFKSYHREKWLAFKVGEYGAVTHEEFEFKDDARKHALGIN